MTWNRTQFEIADTEMGRMTVSGWASSAGIGLHVEDESIDELGRRRWNVTHLRSGIMFLRVKARTPRSEEHTSELQSLMRISYAVFCLKKKKKHETTETNTR